MLCLHHLSWSIRAEAGFIVGRETEVMSPISNFCCHRASYIAKTSDWLLTTPEGPHASRQQFHLFCPVGKQSQLNFPSGFPFWVPIAINNFGETSGSNVSP